MRRKKKHWFPTETDIFLKRHKNKVKQILQLETKMAKMTDEALKARIQELKSLHQSGTSLDELLVETYAIIRESAYRVLGLKAFSVQLMGGIVLHTGEIAEMKTGEGKTLVGTFPTILNAMSGKGVHVVTVNDYLTKRDWELNEPLYTFLGFSSGYVITDMDIPVKQAAYHKDITYVVNQQLGFDYLNDNRILDESQKLQRELHFAIIDEVDSILLDDARTPMILSENESSVSFYYQYCNQIVQRLEPEDVEVDKKSMSAFLTDSGTEKVEKWMNIENLTDGNYQELNHYIYAALVANFYFEREKHYIVRNGMIELIDENTGRITSGRRYSNGLHQAIEAKEGVPIQKESATLCSITYQHFFQLYEKICGMTGTAVTDKEELEEVYRLQVIQLPTNRPIQRVDNPDIVYSTYEKKLSGIVKDVKDAHTKGQPVLVGTSTIEQSEEIDRLLTELGLPHTLLNAKNPEKEASIISQAGQLGAITVATNMAGRGTDIKLGYGVKEVGGLRVIGTERNMNRRVDNQLRGRSGRQGDVGESQFHISLDDELLKVYGTDGMRAAVELLGVASGNEAGVVQNAYLSNFIERAQIFMEGNHYDGRKQTLQYDNAMDEQRRIFYEDRNRILTNEVTVATVISKSLSKQLDAYFSARSGESLSDISKRIQKDFHWLPPKQTGSDKEVLTAWREKLEKSLCKKVNWLKDEAPENVQTQVKQNALRAIDKEWQRHLDGTDEVRTWIHLAQYAQKNPLEAYFFHISEAFNQMNDRIQFHFLTEVSRLRPMAQTINLFEEREEKAS